MDHSKKVGAFRDAGNSQSISELMVENLDVWADDKTVYDYVEKENLHFNLIYAISRQGKSFFMRNIIRFYLKHADPVNTAIFIIKQTLEAEDRDLYRMASRKQVTFRKFDVETRKIIEGIIAEKERNMKAYFAGKESLNKHRFVLFFDDIQGVDEKEAKLLNKVLNKLAKQGRHYDICVYIGVQSYKQIHKDVRSQASLFLTFFPIDSEYRPAVHKEFFNIGRYREFDAMVLPRYSLMGVVKSEGKKFVIFRGGKPKEPEKSKVSAQRH